MNLDESTLEFRDGARQAACRAALIAWRAIQPYYHGTYEIHEKPDGPATDADRLADRLIVETLQAEFPTPEYGYLTEESVDATVRLSCERVWIIDPIDGTREFIKHNGNFAMHIGLAERLSDGLWHAVAAAVYRPVAGTMYSATLGGGAFKQELGAEATQAAQGHAISDSVLLNVDKQRDQTHVMRSVVSNSHSTSRLTRLIDSLNLEDYWHVGSLGVKLCSIAEGEAELYVNVSLGMTKEWDTCAPHLILEQAGGRLTDLTGGVITYNRADPRHMQGLLASNGTIHSELIKRVAEFLNQEELRRAEAPREPI